MPGTIHVHHFPDAICGTAGRRVRVWTPRSYDDDPDLECPVFYLQDGQNVFGPVGSFAGVGWHTEEIARRLIRAERVVPLILVGIDNAGEHRTDDYTPVEWNGKGGHADDYADLLLDGIKPFVDRNYRTQPEPAATALGGSSLGALFTLFVGLHVTNEFGKLMAMSPSLFWGEYWLSSHAPARPRKGSRLWLDVGGHETPEMRRGAREFAVALADRGWKRHRSPRLANLRFVEVPEGRHEERSWGRRFGKALEFLFPAQPHA